MDRSTRVHRSWTCSRTVDRRDGRRPSASTLPVTRRARANARRRIASVTHCSLGCTQAPRPGSRRRTSTSSRTMESGPAGDVATTRDNSATPARRRQPTHVRTGPATGSGGRSAGTRTTEGAVRRTTVHDCTPHRRSSRLLGASRRTAGVGPPVRDRAGGHPSRAPSGHGRTRAAGGPGGRPAAGAVSVASSSASEWMSMRQPVSRAASRAFWPSRPIASESW